MKHLLSIISYGALASDSFFLYGSYLKKMVDQNLIEKVVELPPLVLTLHNGSVQLTLTFSGQQNILKKDHL
jgi:hypothetical protein